MTIASTNAAALLIATAVLPTATGAQSRIVFSSDRSGPWRIWIMDADGSDMRQLTAGASDAHDVDPVFRPDGKAILFSSTRGGKLGVWSVSIDGTEPERLCDGDQAEWSPDGHRIVFRRDEKLFTRDLATGGRSRSPQQIGLIAPGRRGARTRERSPSLAGGMPAMRSSW